MKKIEIDQANNVEVVLRTSLWVRGNILWKTRTEMWVGCLTHLLDFEARKIRKQRSNWIFDA
jgi:hypothetical protein